MLNYLIYFDSRLVPYFNYGWEKSRQSASRKEKRVLNVVSRQENPDFPPQDFLYYNFNQTDRTADPYKDPFFFPFKILARQDFLGGHK